MANSGRPSPRTLVVWRLEGEEERVSGAELVREDVADSGSVGLVGDILIFGGVLLIDVTIVCVIISCLACVLLLYCLIVVCCYRVYDIWYICMV